MGLTKARIAEKIQNDLGFPQKKSTELVETVLALIKEPLSSDENVLISGFGKFCVKKKNKRRGRNPATKEDLILRERKVVTFKCSGKLRKLINGG